MLCLKQILSLKSRLQLQKLPSREANRNLSSKHELQQLSPFENISGNMEVHPENEKRIRKPSVLLSSNDFNFENASAQFKWF